MKRTPIYQSIESNQINWYTACARCFRLAADVVRTLQQASQGRFSGQSNSNCWHTVGYHREEEATLDQETTEKGQGEGEMLRSRSGRWPISGASCSICTRTHPPNHSSLTLPPTGSNPWQFYVPNPKNATKLTPGG